jgi:molybdopterin synthase sulfur carrier subunit
MKVHVRYFASVRETVGVAQEEWELPDTVRTLAQARDWLTGRSGRHAAALSAERPLRMACNQVMSGGDATLEQGCELAFFPPVTGG